jgi:hypothetical protein
MPRIVKAFLISLLPASAAAQGYVSPFVGPSTNRQVVQLEDEHCTEGYGLCELLHIRFDKARTNK